MPRSDGAADVAVGSVPEALEKLHGAASSPDDDGHHRAGLTAGLVVAVLAALLLVTGLITAAVYIRRRRSQQTATSTGLLKSVYTLRTVVQPVGRNVSNIHIISKYIE